MATVLEKGQKLTYVENFAMALYQVFTSIKNSIISENLVLLTQNEQFRAKSAHIRPTITPDTLVNWCINSKKKTNKTKYLRRSPMIWRFLSWGYQSSVES